MAAAENGSLHVELVAPDRTVWSGDAEMVIARTTEGDLGILRGHAPVLSLLTDAVVEISTTEHGVVVVAVDGGFISVADDRVSVLSDNALLPNEIDVDQARTELEEARNLVGAGDEAEQRLRRAEARIRAVEKAS
jgi:F-type H+-transporting ATPase subunit epsilon